jgi:FixJ family two-component response regulator
VGNIIEAFDSSKLRNAVAIWKPAGLVFCSRFLASLRLLQTTCLITDIPIPAISGSSSSATSSLAPFV